TERIAMKSMSSIMANWPLVRGICGMGGFLGGGTARVGVLSLSLAEEGARTVWHGCRGNARTQGDRLAQPYRVWTGYAKRGYWKTLEVRRQVVFNAIDHQFNRLVLLRVLRVRLDTGRVGVTPSVEAFEPAAGLVEVLQMAHDGQQIGAHDAGHEVDTLTSER